MANYIVDKKLEKLSEIDESRFKARDLPLLFAVEKNLRENGLLAYVGGSVVSGEPRTYQDIDLLIPQDSKNKERDALAFRLLARCRSGKDLEVEDEGGVRLKYLGGNVIYFHGTMEHRFMITAGRTKIDLCFEGVSRNSPNSSLHLDPEFNEDLLTGIPFSTFYF